MSVDRCGLEHFADRYLDALVARDPARLPLHSTFRLTENGQTLRIGDGLWGTASARGTYQHVVTDPDTGSIALTAVLQENGMPVIAGMRLAIRDQQLAEAEMIVSRTDILFYKDGPANLEAMGRPAPIWTETVPVAERHARAELVALANAYFDTLERNNGQYVAPFEQTCRRLDNGVFATQAPAFDKEGDKPFYGLGPAEQFALGYFIFVTGLRERRAPVVDIERGVVATFPFLDHAGTIHQARLTDGRTVPIGVKQPFSWQICELFKMRKGKIAQIEVVLNRVPYGMTSGW
ncbi:MAG: hypothetical protein IT480_16335 [Gammaproteobacteria bacterium]|nr:hypothetical protein [Gammaproteobacteria bacterium]